MTSPFLTQLKQLQAPTELIQTIEGLSTTELEAVHERINESNHSVLEWAESLIEIKLFLNRENRDLSLEHCLEYLSCCAESQATNGKLTDLKTNLYYFLKNYGIH